MDGGQRRVGVGRDVQVVEANDAQVFGHAQASLARRPDDADRHDVAHRQDGRGPDLVLPDATECGHSAVEGGRPDDDALVRQRDAPEVEALAVAGQTPRRHGLGRARGKLEKVGHVRRLNADDHELAMAETQQVAGGGSSSHFVVRFDRPMLGEGIPVDEDHRDAGVADLLDLRVVLGEADGHETVDGGAAESPDQRPVKRRDEEQPIAGLVRDGGHSPTQRGEEGVGEDGGECLRGEQADRHGVLLGQHPGHGMGPITQAVRNLANPLGGRGAQAFRAVEGE